MKIFILVIVYILFQPNSILSQHSWQFYAGVDHSNIIHSKLNQQIVYAHTLNSPHWAYGWQAGLNSLWEISSYFDLSFGSKIQLKGDKDSIKFLDPNSTPQDLRFIDLTFPLSMNYRLLEGKNLFLKMGICGNILIKQKSIENFGEFFPINTFKDRLTVSGQIGIIFPIFHKFAGELIYSEGLSNIFSKSYVMNGQTIKWEYRHQVFELNVILSL